MMYYIKLGYKGCSLHGLVFVMYYTKNWDVRGVRYTDLFS